MSKRKKFILITITHFVISISLMLLSFKETMRQFEVGGELSFLSNILGNFVTVLFSPFIQLVKLLPNGSFPGLWGYIPIFLNSCLWALVLLYVYEKFRTKSA